MVMATVVKHVVDPVTDVATGGGDSVAALAADIGGLVTGGAARLGLRRVQYHVRHP